MEEVCFLIRETYYPSDISYSKDETLRVNVGVAVSGEAWEIFCQDYDFRKGHVMIIWHKNIDLFGCKIFNSHVNNIYGIAKIWPEYIHDENGEAICNNLDVFDASIEPNMAVEKGVVRLYVVKETLFLILIVLRYVKCDINLLSFVCYRVYLDSL